MNEALLDIVVALAVRAIREAEKDKRAVETDGEEVNDEERKAALHGAKRTGGQAVGRGAGQLDE